MALHSPTDFADIVNNYIDGWRQTGWMPECRSNNLPGWTQGGSDGDNIVSHFAVIYHNEAAELGVNLDDLYSALVTDAEVNPPEWNIHGRQVNVYKCVTSLSIANLSLTYERSFTLLENTDMYLMLYLTRPVLGDRHAKAAELWR